MTSDAAEEFHRRLDLARNGGGLLFCGAGFSADCLNFQPDETLGTGTQLLHMFNSELKQDPPFRNLQNAADEMWDKIGEYGMEKLLKERFTVSNVTTDMTDLMRFPWQAVYTTNYDNALELAAHHANRRVETINNTDDPAKDANDLEIVHLHGCVKKWDIHNIRESCVLGAESYSRLTHVKSWLDRFRRDVDKAQIVVFVGFNAGDFHLSQAIRDVTGLREKAFFVNRPAAQADPDVAADQKRLGTPFYSGRAGLAAAIREMLSHNAPKEPNLASFSRFVPAEAAKTIPTAAQIEDLFIFGKIDHTQLARDAAGGRSDYRMQRRIVDETVTAIEEGTRIVLFDGHPCDGKTLITVELCQRLSGGRPIYRMRQPYETLLNEVADVLHYAPNAVMVIENCFDFPPERLESIAKQFDGNDGILVLTSRAVAVDASPMGMNLLEGLSSFRKQPIVRLSDDEAQSLSDLVDQIAGWRDFHSLGVEARLRFIQNTCQSSLPHFLMRFLESEYVRDRYQEEFSKLSLSANERDATILALYIAHIGENAPVAFLSNTMGPDYGSIIDGMNRKVGNNTFRLVRREGAMIETVPSIGAVNILSNLFEDRHIVDTIAPFLRNLSATYRNPFEQRMFNQLMRFSVLSNVVQNREEIDRFYEHSKQEQQIRRMPLFWLQWHMAKCAVGDLLTAENLLDQGYAEAKEYEGRTGKKFDRRQLDDRRAKFVMLRAVKENRSGADLFRDFKEAIELNGKIMRQDDPQYYPFETLKEITNSFEDLKHRLLEVHLPIVQAWLKALCGYGEKRIGVLIDGYQKNRAQKALEDATARVAKLNRP